jgi:hypothetical protein
MGPDSVGNVQKILPFGAVFCDLASTCTTVTLGLLYDTIFHQIIKSIFNYFVDEKPNRT